jgi:hypothetical protein
MDATARGSKRAGKTNNRPISRHDQPGGRPARPASGSRDVQPDAQRACGDAGEALRTGELRRPRRRGRQSHRSQRVARAHPPVLRDASGETHRAAHGRRRPPAVAAGHARAVPRPRTPTPATSPSAGTAPPTRRRSVAPSRKGCWIRTARSRSVSAARSTPRTTSTGACSRASALSASRNSASSAWRRWPRWPATSPATDRLI